VRHPGNWKQLLAAHSKGLKGIFPVVEIRQNPFSPAVAIRRTAQNYAAVERVCERPTLVRGCDSDASGSRLKRASQTLTSCIRVTDADEREAILRSTNSTMMRVPRMTGLPSMISWSVMMRGWFFMAESIKSQLKL
jgi:hypothetical protein